MNRLYIVLALALASLSSVACTASSEEPQGEEQTASSEEAQGQEEHLGQSQEKLSCHRFPKDTCVTVGSYCERHGGQLWCDLYGNCTCKFSVFQAVAAPALAP
ncbi:MAG TPA: hypothetical protein VLT33_27995 [Labilithrix sp.]|nr:hypothetical protein [Labilithrix sp.]